MTGRRRLWSRCCGSTRSHSSTARRWARAWAKLAKRTQKLISSPFASILLGHQILEFTILVIPVVMLVQNLAVLFEAGEGVRIHGNLAQRSHAFRIHFLWLMDPIAQLHHLLRVALRSCSRHGNTRQGSKHNEMRLSQGCGSFYLLISLKCECDKVFPNNFIPSTLVTARPGPSRKIPNYFKPKEPAGRTCRENQAGEPAGELISSL